MLVGLNGYSMLCGPLHRGNDNLESLAAISNRYQMHDEEIIPKAIRLGTTKHESVGIAYSVPNNPLPVVAHGQALFSSVIRTATTQAMDEDGLIQELFKLLDTNSVPESAAYVTSHDLKYSIFIPPFSVDSTGKQLKMASSEPGIRAYNHSCSEGVVQDHCCLLEGVEGAGEVQKLGTRQQTIILLSNKQGAAGKVTYVEKTLFLDADPQVVKETFFIEDWGKEDHNYN